jgi:hypothetical protein
LLYNEVERFFVGQARIEMRVFVTFRSENDLTPCWSIGFDGVTVDVIPNGSVRSIGICIQIRSNASNYYVTVVVAKIKLRKNAIF